MGLADGIGEGVGGLVGGLLEEGNFARIRNYWTSVLL